MKYLCDFAYARFEEWYRENYGETPEVDEETSREIGRLVYEDKEVNNMWRIWQDCEIKMMEKQLYLSVRMEFLEDLGDLYIEKDDGWTYAISTETAQGYITAQGDTLAQAVDALKEMIEERRNG